MTSKMLSSRSVGRRLCGSDSDDLFASFNRAIRLEKIKEDRRKRLKKEIMKFSTFPSFCIATITTLVSGMIMGCTPVFHSVEAGGLGAGTAWGILAAIFFGVWLVS